MGKSPAGDCGRLILCRGLGAAASFAVVFRRRPTVLLAGEGRDAR